MSNIYIQEPPTNGKVLLSTTAGDLDIELWSREAPRACRNFIQLCMESYYDNTIFHRLVKDFIVQGGDPTGTGEGGESVWGAPFKDEFHSRLRFTHRGRIAMANSSKNDNGSQFFFTLAPTLELQDKHTIFGKVVGDTIYNLLRLGEGEVGEDERPLYPHKILKTTILSDPFGDIEPRNKAAGKKEKKDVVKATGTKNFKLLSFGEEAEVDEEEDDEVNKALKKAKSSHDLLVDPLLSGEAPPVGEEEEEIKTNEEEDKLTVESVREKLKGKGQKKIDESSKPKKSKDVSKESEDEEEYYLGKDEELLKQEKLKQLKKDYRELRKEMKKKEDDTKEEEKVKEENKEKEARLAESSNSLIKEFYEEQKIYKERKSTLKKESREADTLALLKKFEEKMRGAATVERKEPVALKRSGDNEEDEEDDPTDTTWLSQPLQHHEEELVLAKDANTKTDDWFEIYDPRNTLTKRRRENQSSTSKKM